MSTGINRNILECKYKVMCNWQMVLQRINRNILECKYPYRNLIPTLFLVLIETYWNVNI